MQIEWPQRRGVLLLAVVFEGGLVILALVLGWLLRQPVWNCVYWTNEDMALGIATCLPMLGIFLMCIGWPIGPLARIKQFSEEIVRPMFALCTWWELALIALLAGIGEEGLFRGVLQEVFSRWWGIGVGVVVASLLFGLMHPITPTYVILAAGLGAYLGWLWIVTANLLVPITAHALYDWLALLYLVYGPDNTPLAPWGRGVGGEG